MAHFHTGLPVAADMRSKPVVKIKTFPSGVHHSLSVKWGKLLLSMDLDEARYLVNEMTSALTIWDAADHG